MYDNAGIYKIENLVNGKVYIGSSVDIKNRWRQHLQCLVKGKHGNRYLQRAWDKYGAENFKFDIVEKCDSKILVEREQQFMDFFDACQCGYNLSPTAGSNLGIIHSEESRKKNSIARTGKKRGPHSEEHRRKISIAGKGIKKKPLSEEHKRILSMRLKGKPQPFNCKPSPFKGRPGHLHTEETKRRISETMKKVRAGECQLEVVSSSNLINAML
ncbi:MAG TPA: GIY-YIG nuclease family protein [Candidatus Wunengus sp. YC61]|uniref:GIY-YIG nuclease family protein n=1 Tax=Candidatus Wunengus sp. YC61 TaxID=3367698 RepID=UPI004027CDA4